MSPGRSGFYDDTSHQRRCLFPVAQQSHCVIDPGGRFRFPFSLIFPEEISPTIEPRHVTVDDDASFRLTLRKYIATMIPF